MHMVLVLTLTPVRRVGFVSKEQKGHRHASSIQAYGDRERHREDGFASRKFRCPLLFNDLARAPAKQVERSPQRRLQS